MADMLTPSDWKIMYEAQEADLTNLRAELDRVTAKWHALDGKVHDEVVRSLCSITAMIRQETKAAESDRDQWKARAETLERRILEHKEVAENRESLMESAIAECDLSLADNTRLRKSLEEIAGWEGARREDTVPAHHIADLSIKTAKAALSTTPEPSGGEPEKSLRELIIRLMNELKPWLENADVGMSELYGNTNYVCLKNKFDDLSIALQGGTNANRG